jgi:hypothetical protein
MQAKPNPRIGLSLLAIRREDLWKKLDCIVTFSIKLKALKCLSRAVEPVLAIRLFLPASQKAKVATNQISRLGESAFKTRQ